MLACRVDGQLPAGGDCLLLQPIFQNNHGRIFSGKMSGVKDPQSRILGPAGNGMLHFGGDKRVRTLLQGNFSQIGAGAAADRNRRHLKRPLARLKYPGRIAGLLDAGEQIGGRHRRRIGADPTKTPRRVGALAGRNQRPSLRQAEGGGENIADATCDRVEIGMAGDYTDVFTERCCHDPTDGGIGAERFQRPKDDGMVSDNQIISSGTGPFHEGAGGIKRQQDTMDRLVRIASEEADVVPVFSQIFRGYLLQNIEKILNGRHNGLLYKEKEAHPPGMYLFLDILFNAPLLFQP